MNYYEFKKRLSIEQLAPVYLLHGEEDYLKEEALRLISKGLEEKFAGQLEVVNLEEDSTLSFIIEVANTVPLFSGHKLILARNMQVFGAKKGQAKQQGQAGEEELWEAYLENPSPMSTLVFILKGKADAKKKIYKVLDKKGYVVETEQLRGRDLAAWAKNSIAARGKTIDYATLDYLLACVSNDLGILEHEIEKLCLYTGKSTAAITQEHVQALISKTSQITIFSLVDAFAERRGSAAIQYCRDLLKMGEAEVLIVYMLARQFRLMLETKLLLEKGYTTGQLPQVLQTQAYAVHKAVKQGQRFSVAQLLAALEKLLELDVAIKTGQGNPALLLEMAIGDFCR